MIDHDGTLMTLTQPLVCGAKQIKECFCPEMYFSQRVPKGFVHSLDPPLHSACPWFNRELAMQHADVSLRLAQLRLP